jgi:ATP-dependent DNA helicase RecQ
MPECVSSCDCCAPNELFTKGTKGRRSKKAGTGSLKVVARATSESDELFAELKVLRRQIADEHGVPAFVVFSDATLREIAARHPVSLGDFLDVPGVGPYKLERYGGAFLDLLRRT